MKPMHTLLAGVAAATIGATAAIGSAQGEPAGAHGARAVTVELRHSSLGSILVSGSGFTLYEFTRDRAAQNSCAKLKGCSAAWPALQSAAAPTGGPGVSASLLSSIRLPGAIRQVTYAGHPLYLFSGDSTAASTSYVGRQEFGGAWYGVNASGHAVK